MSKVTQWKQKSKCTPDNIRKSINYHPVKEKYRKKRQEHYSTKKCLLQLELLGSGRVLVPIYPVKSTNV